jgi:hypothetical protein
MNLGDGRTISLSNTLKRIKYYKPFLNGECYKFACLLNDVYLFFLVVTDIQKLDNIAFLIGKLLCYVGNYLLNKHMTGKLTKKHTKRVIHTNCAENTHRQQHTWLFIAFL